MLNYYLSSFGKINWTIKVSEELWIAISNVDKKDKKIILHHINGTLNMLSDSHIKNISQLDGLIKISFNNSDYNELMKKGKELNIRRTILLKITSDRAERLKEDKKLYLQAQKIWDQLLEFNNTQKNYLNTLLMCCLLGDYLIDFSNFSLAQKVKFDSDLNFYSIFKPILDYSKERQYLRYLEFDLRKNHLMEIWKTIDSTISFYHGRGTFIKDMGHIWWLVQIYLSSNTDKIKITSLVAILEYLLVREPSPDKVCSKEEDGIIKQFKMKVHEVIKKHKDILNLTETDLKKIYGIRSSIVHGNNRDMEDLENWLYKIKTVVFIVLKEWIADPEYFKVLKNIKKMKNDQ